MARKVMFDWASKNVLVTGGAGFIGSHLVELLVAAEAKVSVLDLAEADRGGNGVGDADLPDAVTMMHGDIRVEHWPALDLDRFDVIFHLAANAYVPPSILHPLTDYETNCGATLNLLDTLRRHNWPGRFVYASSAAVYGNPSRLPVREGDPTVPISPYGVGKLCAERYAAVYAQLYGLQIASLRLFSVYGPRQRKQVVYDLMVKIAAGGAVHIHGDGTQIRDFCYVTDAARAAMHVAAAAEMKGEVYNVASGRECSIARLAFTLCRRMGVTPRLEYTGVNRPGDPEKLTVNISRLGTLGHMPRQSLDAGLAATVDWFHTLPGAP